MRASWPWREMHVNPRPTGQVVRNLVGDQMNIAAVLGQIGRQRVVRAIHPAQRGEIA